ncbi:MAG: ferritin family protein [Deltaproteobacteria bacterium]|nr:ferritin family protein [Deltaproteobacteria bacterium]
MGYEFSADEVFQMAEQIEINGESFYREMSEKIPDSAIKRTLLDLAAMENEHRKIFARMRAELSEGEREASVFDPEGESALYLRALADLRVFGEKAREDFELSPGTEEEEKIRRILLAASGREKESIVFYTGMRDIVPKAHGRDRVDAIIREEMKHLTLLASKLAALKEKGTPSQRTGGSS